MHRWRSALAFLVMSCAPPEEEIEEEFRDFVATRKDCSSDDDCVLAATGCPLGCGTAVNRAHQAAVESKARELIADYESAGRACAYGCNQLVATCVDTQCSEVEP
jgi:hypothetical protein